MRAFFGASLLLASGLLAAAACGGSSDATSPRRDGGASSTSADAASGVDATATDAGPTCSPDIETDPKNCGTCGHDCLGSPCLAGRCVPVVIVGALPSPDAIRVDGAYLYWQSAYDGLVWRVPKGGGAPELLTPNPVDIQVQPRPLIYLDTTYLYFSNADKQSIQRVPKTGQTGGAQSELVFGLINMSPIFTADADNLYVAAALFSGNGGMTIFRVSKSAPGTGSAMADIVNIASLAVDDTRLYWAELDGPQSISSGSVRAIDKTIAPDAGAPTVLASNQGNPHAVNVDGAQVYWANTDTGAVKSVPKAGGAGATVALAQFQPASLVIDALNLYWIDLGNGDIMTCPLSGCGAGARALAVDQASPSSLAVDDTAVYWTAKSGGALMKVAK